VRQRNGKAWCGRAKQRPYGARTKTKHKEVEMTEETKPKKQKKERVSAKLEPNSMMVHLKFVSPVLGTAPGNPDIYSEFIAQKSADAEKVKAELESLPADELEDRGMTVFHRTEDGIPMLYDYQVKGFIKEFFRIFVEYGDIRFPGGINISKWTVDRHIDNYVFVYGTDKDNNREIPIKMPDGTKIKECVRPLRAKTQRGERIALACSEQVPKGSEIEFIIEWLNPNFEEYIRKALDNGRRKGIGQWRNSGMGRFEWKEVESVKKDAAA